MLENNNQINTNENVENQVREEQEVFQLCQEYIKEAENEFMQTKRRVKKLELMINDLERRINAKDVLLAISNALATLYDKIYTMPDCNESSELISCLENLSASFNNVGISVKYHQPNSDYQNGATILTVTETDDCTLEDKVHSCVCLGFEGLGAGEDIKENLIIYKYKGSQKQVVQEEVPQEENYLFNQGVDFELYQSSEEAKKIDYIKIKSTQMLDYCRGYVKIKEDYIEIFKRYKLNWKLRKQYEGKNYFSLILCNEELYLLLEKAPSLIHENDVDAEKIKLSKIKGE